MHFISRCRSTGSLRFYGFDPVAGPIIPSLSLGCDLRRKRPFGGLGWNIFGERIEPAFWLAVSLIVLGIIITQFASQSS
jgi:drug/metabolite transporter (DMT)-like permease